MLKRGGRKQEDQVQKSIVVDGLGERGQSCHLLDNLSVPKMNTFAFNLKARKRDDGKWILLVVNKSD